MKCRGQARPGPQRGKKSERLGRRQRDRQRDEGRGGCNGRGGKKEWGERKENKEEGFLLSTGKEGQVEGLFWGADSTPAVQPRFSPSSAPPPRAPGAAFLTSWRWAVSSPLLPASTPSVKLCYCRSPSPWTPATHRVQSNASVQHWEPSPAGSLKCIMPPHNLPIYHLSGLFCHS